LLQDSHNKIKLSGSTLEDIIDTSRNSISIESEPSSLVHQSLDKDLKSSP